jgi:hypothetical protein
MSTSQELDRLENILNADAVSPAILEGLKDLSAESKNQIVARVAHTLEPPPSARLLMRLLLLVTEENRGDMTKAFIVNLHSPYPEARGASLIALEKLGNPNIVDFAVASLRDNDDQVIAAACSILLSKGNQEPRVRSLLQQLYAAHKGKAQFHMSLSLLEAHGVDK